VAPATSDSKTSAAITSIKFLSFLLLSLSVIPTFCVSALLVGIELFIDICWKQYLTLEVLSRISAYPRLSDSNVTDRQVP